MRVRSPIPKKHARIEIIPLIDIMFFLLASFMMVSLSQTHMKGIRVNLPAPNSAPPQQDPNQKDYVSIRVTEGNLIYFDNAPMLDEQILPRLYELYQDEPRCEGFPQRRAECAARRCDYAARSCPVGRHHEDRLPDQDGRADWFRGNNPSAVTGGISAVRNRLRSRDNRGAAQSPARGG